MAPTDPHASTRDAPATSALFAGLLAFQLAVLMFAAFTQIETDSCFPDSTEPALCTEAGERTWWVALGGLTLAVIAADVLAIVQVVRARRAGRPTRRWPLIAGAVTIGAAVPFGVVVWLLVR